MALIAYIDLRLGLLDSHVVKPQHDKLRKQQPAKKMR